MAMLFLPLIQLMTCVRPNSSTASRTAATVYETAPVKVVKAAGRGFCDALLVARTNRRER